MPPPPSVDPRPSCQLFGFGFKGCDASFGLFRCPSAGPEFRDRRKNRGSRQCRPLARPRAFADIGYRGLLASELILVRNQSKVTHIEWRLCPSQRDQNCPVPKSVSHSQFAKNIRIQIRKIGYYNVRLIKVSENRPVYRSSAADKVGADSVENALSTLKHTFSRRWT